MIILADAVEAYLSNYPEEIRRITIQLRDMAKRTMPKAHEFLYYETVSYSLSNSPIERICYISPSEKHVTLGFSFGAQLNDQDHTLKGTSKRARHITVKTSEDAKNSAIKKLVKAAWTKAAETVSKWRIEMRQRRALIRKRARRHKHTNRATQSRRRRR